MIQGLLKELGIWSSKPDVHIWVYGAVVSRLWEGSCSVEGFVVVKLLPEIKGRCTTVTSGKFHRVIYIYTQPTVHQRLPNGGNRRNMLGLWFLHFKNSSFGLALCGRSPLSAPVWPRKACWPSVEAPHRVWCLARWCCDLLWITAGVRLK